MTSYSQFGEDRWILEHLPLPEKGTFVEVGAYDGISSSNTYGFEREGWTGVCIEPDPDMAIVCRRNRKALTLSCAIGTGSTLQEFIINPADRGTSALKRPDVGHKVIVPVCRLDDLFDLYGLPDLLSIDTEGSELNVWDTLGGIRGPRIVIMEFWTQPNPPVPEPIIERMKLSGYTEVHRTTANLIFLR